MIRLICEFRCENPVALLAELEALRTQFQPQEAEAFRSLAEGEDDALGLSMLFESESDISALLEHIREFPALQQAFNTGALELYKQELFKLDGDKWVPSRGYEPRIMWPARGGIRIVILGTYEENPEMRQLTAQEIAETRREPGCLSYAWYENLEEPNHLVLLELWSDAVQYDAHWYGRTETVEYRGDSGRVPTKSKRGRAAREFYRHQEFDLQYGRLLPKNPFDYSQTVVWPSS
ncbi:putative quinol monooxygenase [Corynebacterium sp. HMSC29G08]|uniref:putative quinol monooxygenase n=1 Tax=Corynebacterium sp. HMSC29G08 TaxID=1581069 RepID=UPI0008A61431|nr:antibiotic biosynthesis monooxygenase [Corynebacterium sp. HMSC29G08]OFT86224.1 hypothetical protein HMPREF3101_00405 [Corynebacterium sp. HMSC29G08]